MAPVPPSCEDKLKPVPKLQTNIERCTESGLVGLEYIIKLICSKNIEPNYHCFICEAKFNASSIMVHIKSYGHRLKYLVSHLQVKYYTYYH